jgi:hypothetical protein
VLVAASTYLIIASLTFLYLRIVGNRAAAFVVVDSLVLFWMALKWPLTVPRLVKDIAGEWRRRDPDSRLH